MIKFRTTLAVACLTVLGATLAGVGPAAAAPDVLGKFVYVGDSGQKDLYVANPDGTGRMNITNTPAVNELMPSVAPDGSKVAFVREAAGIWVINLDGTGLTQLTSNASDLTPDWSPDGSQIVFTRGVSEHDLLKMNADGSNPVKIIENDVDDETPAWSPDGQWIAFSARPVGMFLVHPDGTGLQSLGSYSYCRKDQAWAPDSNRFAFTQCEFDGSSNIWVFDLELFSSTQLTPDAGTESQPDWSPDGSTIAYTKLLRGGTTAVYAIDADGTNQRPITPRSIRLKESDPSWLPA
ncbi:MAG: PD40 domain-containing protein [Actinobacteria bacterium]|nr:PD40 domain-containing protein [Actinomycetota bacterium]